MEAQNITPIQNIESASMRKSDLDDAAVQEYTLLEKQGRGYTHIRSFVICLNPKARKAGC